MSQRNRQSGFTIIEVLIVVGLMGILAALALPSFRLSIVRAKMTEALAAFGPCRNMISETLVGGGAPPDAGEPWGCESANTSTYVSDVSVNAPEGIVKITLRGFGDLRVDTYSVTLAPLTSTGAYLSGAGDEIKSWRCGATADGTDQELQKYLPSSCRGY